jgi:hypothetical protein
VSVPARLATLAAVTLLAAACTSGKHEARGPGAQAAPAPATARAPLTVRVDAAAQGLPEGADAKAAADKAEPSIERFLATYLRAAFLDPKQQQTGYRDVLALFDGPVRRSARRDLAALTLGPDSGRIRGVQPGPATAQASVLFAGGQPAAATVKLSFDGSAQVDQGSGPVRLRSVFNLLNTRQGWRIAAYQSRTGAAR